LAPTRRVDQVGRQNTAAPMASPASCCPTPLSASAGPPASRSWALPPRRT